MNIDVGILANARNECRKLLTEQVGVLGVVISSVDGFDVASAVTRDLEPAKIAAMASSIAAIGIVVSQEASLGASKSITVNTEDGFVYITNIELAGQLCALNVIANSSAILAQIIYHSGEIKRRLEVS
ncbi:MAG: hypothetical protein B0W54_19955 [Cellvibrio sp. 79]|nr:MAG: hypothetical protein B0W54_19955 [Cellvibrio sp. 79]